jgi:hypothetical protein
LRELFVDPAVVISYAREDARSAPGPKRHLNEERHRCGADTRDFQPRPEWDRRIADPIASS